MNNLHLAVQFFLQLAVILLFCRMVGAIAGRFGQPHVVAEMSGGGVLGPSFCQVQLVPLQTPEQQSAAAPQTSPVTPQAQKVTAPRARHW